MAIEIISETVIRTCDICCKKCDTYNDKTEATIEIQHHTLNNLGERSGWYSRKRDLCDACLLKVNNLIDGLIKNA
jgi:hypothetical protein